MQRTSERTRRAMPTVFAVVAVAVVVASGAIGRSAAAAESGQDTGPLPHKHIIAAENPLAAQAGLAVLRQGGSAVDAAIAAQMVLTLVEPQATGIGGGALLLHYDAATQSVTAWDGRETAPAAAGPDLFLDRDRKPLSYLEGGLGGRAVGVPGVLRMLEAVHKAYGKLPWASLFTDAIRLADGGVPVPKRMAEAIALDRANLRQAAMREAFLQPDGTPLAEGATYVNKPLADMLRAIAAGGADALMTGPVAAEIATAVRTDPNPGLLTVDDLGAYKAQQRPPVCGPYRGRRVCGFGPPSAGGVAVLQTLGLLAHFDLGRLAPPPGAPTWRVDAAQLMMEAQRLAHADRLLYLADTDFVAVPVRGLLEPDYLTIRAQAIDVDRANPAPRAGNPSWDADAAPLAPAPPFPEHGTSEIAVIDDAGDAVSMTTTVQDRFGARLLVRGFVLNNELTDFSPVPERDGRPVANRVEAGKRPRSSMSPTFVFDREGKLELIAGSVGGADIVSYVAQALVETLDFRRTPAQAVASPRIATQGGDVLLEAGTAATALASPLRARGQTVREAHLDSGTIVVRVTSDGFAGAADPRREGVALGD